MRPRTPPATARQDSISSAVRGSASAPGSRAASARMGLPRMSSLESTPRFAVASSSPAAGRSAQERRMLSPELIARARRAAGTTASSQVLDRKALRLALGQSAVCGAQARATASGNLRAAHDVCGDNVAASRRQTAPLMEQHSPSQRSDAAGVGVAPAAGPGGASRAPGRGSSFARCARTPSRRAYARSAPKVPPAPQMAS